MREIKFRAWDSETQTMIIDREDISITGNGLVLFDYGNNAPKERYERTETFVVMQHTGLKDKNGVEIYHKDWLHNPNDKKRYYIIEWNEEQGCWSLGKDGELLKKFQLNIFWEVVGNDYQGLKK